MFVVRNKRFVMFLKAISNRLLGKSISVPGPPIWQTYLKLDTPLVNYKLDTPLVNYKLDTPLVNYKLDTPLVNYKLDTPLVDYKLDTPLVN